MAARLFLRATIATNDISFVSVVGRQFRSWICHTVSPQLIWSPEHRAIANKHEPEGGWVKDPWRDAFGELYSKKADVLEFYVHLVAGPTLQKAISQTQTWLGKFSLSDTVVLLVWDGVVFLDLGDLKYQVTIEVPYDRQACLKRFRQLQMVQHVEYNNKHFQVQFHSGDLQKSCQALVDAIG